MPRGRKREPNIATRIAAMLGEEPIPRMKMKSFTDDELCDFLGKNATETQRNALKKQIEPYISEKPLDEWNDEALNKTLGCDAFGRQVFNIELQDFQLGMVYLMKAFKDTVFVMGRQSGKDYTLAVFVPWECITEANTRTLIISEGQRASNLLRDRIYGNIATHKASFACVKRRVIDECSFYNGSIIYPLPSKGAIRGFTEVTRVIANEAAYIPDVCFDAFEPMLARVGGSLNLFSTPLGTMGKLYRYFTDKTFAKMQFPSRVNKYLPGDFLDKQRMRMSTTSYMREFEAVFSEAENLYFNPAIIDLRLEDYSFDKLPEKGKYYYMGFDPARTRDSSVVVVLSRDSAGMHKIEHIEEFRDKGFYETQLPCIQDLHGKYNFTKMCVEYAGLGIGPAEALEAGGFPVERFVPEVGNKAQAYDQVKSLLEKGLISLPISHHQLISEMKLLQFKITQGGHISIHHEEGGSDDFADALMLACYAAKTGAMLTNIPTWAGRYDRRGR